ncbi:hypothetical protein [uncultured Aquimarina sp.]|uniref:hypothetical protein n=1 Tax=uncultured Aquimarina sp. TaxID=575652 RepID=UPI002620B99E|nr:hypothetical protein [uncultured Aquimarina sp.]
MLTLEEQLLFIEQQRTDSIKTIQSLQEQFGDRYRHIFTEKINHTIFCCDSILSSLKELQSLKNKTYGK